MSKPTLYVHAGAAKCGSTSIQVFLAQNYSQLRRDRLLYLDEEILPGTHPPRSESHVAYFKEIETKTPEQKQDFFQRMEQVQQHLLKNNLRGAIISAENLTSRAMKLHELFVDMDKLFDVRVIIYVRDQVDYLEASWKQWVFKSGHDLEKWVKQVTQPGKHGDWNIAVSLWENVVGRENIRLGVLNSAFLHDGDLLRDFLHKLDVKNTSAYTFQSDRANVSFNVETVYVLERLSDLYDGYNDHRLDNMLIARAAQLTTKKSRETTIFAKRHIQLIRESHRESNIALFERYYPNATIDEIFPPKEKRRVVLSDEETDDYERLLLWETLRSLHEDIERINKVAAFLDSGVMRRLMKLARRLR